jgi:hypothetical protein
VWEEFGELGDGVVGDAGKDVFEPGEGVYSDSLARSHKATQHRGRGAALVAAKEDPVVATSGYAADRMLSGVVVNLQAPVVAIAVQRRPLLQAVADPQLTASCGTQLTSDNL